MPEVDMKKVHRPVIYEWAAGRLDQICPGDEILIDYTIELLESTQHPTLDLLKSQLSGFLETQADSFCKSLYNLLLEAQKDPDGVPQSLVDQKIAQLSA